jgi:cobyrinic acid a,c-diamide synthase
MKKQELNDVWTLSSSGDRIITASQTEVASLVPRLVIAGTHSGVGKTSISLGIMSAMKSRGLRVQPFKVGPDYLDPCWHRLATGRASYNLDTWMLTPEYVQRLFRQKTRDADIAIIEGVMGLFDGASTTALQGSTAEISRLLNAPILLVADAAGVARSFAATVKGFSEFETGCRIAAAIANFCGSERHASMLQEALSAAGLCGLAGWFPSAAFPELPSRHLGLRPPGLDSASEPVTDVLGRAIEKQIDIDALYRLAGQSSTLDMNCMPDLLESDPAHNPECRGTVAVAMDDAFSFYYPDNLELLNQLGIRTLPFSPLRDAELPAKIDGLYLGGGYPEAHARQLSANTGMLRSIARFAESNRPIYAECGGMMYLASAIVDGDGQSWPMVGLLPFATRMLNRCKRLGYVTTTLAEETLFGPPGTQLRGHEFHYSEIIEPFDLNQWCQPYILRDSRGTSERPGGFARNNVLAGYIHHHFHSNPIAAKSLANAFARHS